MFERDDLPQKDDDWYVVPGIVDNSSYWLLVHLVWCVICLRALQSLLCLNRYPGIGKCIDAELQQHIDNVYKHPVLD